MKQRIVQLGQIYLKVKHMKKIKEFLKTSIGKKVEKYLWEVAVLSLNLLLLIITDLDVTYLVIATPLINQLTKYINNKYLK